MRAGAAAAAAAAAAGQGAGGPGDSPRRPPGGCGRRAATAPGGTADRACGLEGPLGRGTTADSILEGRKWGDWAWVPDSWGPCRSQVGFQTEAGELGPRGQGDRRRGGLCAHREGGEGQGLGFNWPRGWRGADPRVPATPNCLVPGSPPSGVTEESMGNGPGWSRGGRSDGRWPWRGDRAEWGCRGLAYTQAPT